MKEYLIVGREKMADVISGIAEKTKRGWKEFRMNARGYGDYHRGQVITYERRPWNIDKFSLGVDSSVAVSLSFPGDDLNDPLKLSVPFEQMWLNHTSNPPSLAETALPFYGSGIWLEPGV